MHASTTKNGKRVAVMGNTIMVNGKRYDFSNKYHAEAMYRQVLKFR